MMSLQQIVARTKLPISVAYEPRASSPYWLIAYGDPAAMRPWFVEYDPARASSAYLTAVKELSAYTPAVSERGLLLNEVA
jgi:hypothetical protein